MTNTPDNEPVAPIGTEAPAAIDTYDLTPEGLADAPAHEEDSGSIVHTGNS